MGAPDALPWARPAAEAPGYERILPRRRPAMGAP